MLAREKLKMFDPFLTKITPKNSKQLVTPKDPKDCYYDLDRDEREFIDYLLLQVHNNVSNLRTAIDPLLNLKYQPVYGKYETLREIAALPPPNFSCHLLLSICLYPIGKR